MEMDPIISSHLQRDQNKVIMIRAGSLAGERRSAPILEKYIKEVSMILYVLMML